MRVVPDGEGEDSELAPRSVTGLPDTEDLEAVFLQAFRYLIVDETGPESKNDPSRRGHTLGVDNSVISGWIDPIPGNTDGLCPAELELVFFAKIWKVCHCSELSPGLGYFIFDCGVRFGAANASRWLNLAAGLDMLRAFDKRLLTNISPADLVRRVDVYVRRRLKADPQWEVCKHWWTNRANRARDRALKMIREEEVNE